MRIGFDVSQTGQLKAGCGYFADSLIRHLVEIDAENEYVLYPTFGDNYWDPDWSTLTTQINRPNSRRGLGHKTFAAAQLFWSHLPLDFEVQLGNPDLVHANNFFCPPGLQKARLVYTLYDLAFIEHPEWTTEENRIGCFQGVFNASVYADFIIAISDCSRRHFLEIFPHYPADRIVVIYPASRFSARSDFARCNSLPLLESECFWLSVGTLEPRKNHRRLLHAYARLKAHLGKTFPLVLAGSRGWLIDDLEETIESLGLHQDVILLGYVDDTALQWLYQHCFAFIYPSLFEGFGLPVLEAMSLGAPVIASNTTSLPEIVGVAGLLVNPLHEDDLFRAMCKLGTGEVSREALQDRVLEQANRFSWGHAAQQVLEVYQQVTASRSLPILTGGSLPSSLQSVCLTWNRLGEADPLWAILTQPDKKGGRWSLEEFFETGRKDVHDILRYLSSLKVHLNFDKALDFGCGVGRLTRALSEHFQEVYGVDIAQSMIESAKRLNQHAKKCFFQVNLADDLQIFDDNTFDFVITLITLQHMPKQHALNYIAELVRVTKPGGIVIFQVSDSLKTLSSAAQQGTPEMSDQSPTGLGRRDSQMIMSGVRYIEVVETLTKAQARLMDAVEDDCGGLDWLSYRYCATKDPLISVIR